MSRSTWRNRVLASLVYLGLVAVTLGSQTLERPSTTLVIRQQFGSIATEASDSVRLAPGSSVSLSVVAAKDRSLAENAFIDALRHKGVGTWVAGNRDSSDALLTVNVLTDKVGFEQLRHDVFARTVETEVEVRAEFRTDRPAQALGIFRRMLRDTVSQQEADLYPRFGGAVSDEESGFFQRLISPLVVLACGMVVVYLFFTVRS